MIGDGDTAQSQYTKDGAGTSKATDLETNLLKFFHLKRMRLTSLSGDTARSVFELGRVHGFNLFDGSSGITFLGYFVDEDPTEVIARIRFLLNSIDLSYEQVEAQTNIAQRQADLMILNQIRIEVLVSEDAPIHDIESKIEEYRPNGSTVQVALYKPSHVQETVRREYQEMDPRSEVPAQAAE